MKLTTLRPEVVVLGKRAGTNMLWQFLGRVGTQAFQVLFTILIARRLGEVGLGQYSFIVAVVFLANVATTFGTDMFLVREIANDNLTFVYAALILQLVLSLPAIGLILWLPSVGPNLSADTVAALRIYSLALIPMAFYNVSSAALRGASRMDSLAALSLATIAMQVLAVWYLIQPGRGILILAVLLLGVQIAAGLLGVALSVRYVPGLRRAWNLSVSGVRYIARVSAPIALLGVLGFVYQRAAVYLLTILSGPAATGWYSAASRTIEIPKFGHVAVMGALLPVMAQERTQPDETQSFNNLFTISFLALIVFSGLAAGVLYLFASPLVDLFYGEGFAPTVPALKIMAWSLIPFTVTNYLALRIFSAGHEKRMILPLSGSVLALLLTSLLAIPRRGTTGAAGAVLVSESLLALAYVILWQRIRPAVPV